MAWLMTIDKEYHSNTNRLNKADFPTLGRPIIITVGSLSIAILVKSTDSSVEYLTLGSSALLSQQSDFPSFISPFKRVQNLLTFGKTTGSSSETHSRHFEPKFVVSMSLFVKRSNDDPKHHNQMGNKA